MAYAENMLTQISGNIAYKEDGRLKGVGIGLTKDRLLNDGRRMVETQRLDATQMASTTMEKIA